MNQTFSLACIAALAALALAPDPAAATNLRILTYKKVARFAYHGDPALEGGVIIVGRDSSLMPIANPTCPNTSTVEIEAYLQSTQRDSVLAHVDLDCAKWRPTKLGYRYVDPAGTIRSVRYDSDGMRIKIKGPAFSPITGPVGFLQAQLQIGDQILRTRFHNFIKNDLPAVVTRKPSPHAAAGERAFWTVLLGDDTSAFQLGAVPALLQLAADYDRRDGRSRFLLAMFHLYRYGQLVTSVDDVSPAAHAELVAANAAFASAVPLLWNDASGLGDSRVPGFAAAAKYLQGVVDGNAALRQEGLDDLDHAYQLNGFFNVFDYITVLQTLPPSDPVFQQVFALVDAYVNAPEAFGCLTAQPELCGNAGFAPYNLQGSLTLFGDLYAKANQLPQAQFWYNLVTAFPETATWPFQSVIQDRLVDPAARVALYTDGDPSNDPPIIGAGPEACAVCHNR